MTHESKLGKKLKFAREQAGLSQEQTARIINLHRPTISEIEAGRRKVSASELKEFAKIYSVNINWLLGAYDEDVEDNEKVGFAARELSKLKDKDLEKVINLLKALRTREK